MAGGTAPVSKNRSPARSRSTSRRAPARTSASKPAAKSSPPAAKSSPPAAKSSPPAARASDRAQVSPAAAAAPSPRGVEANRGLADTYQTAFRGPNETGAGEPKPSEERSGSLWGGLLGLANTAVGAVTPFDFSKDERGQLEGARDTLSRLAGPDGRWGPGDLSRNLAQIQPDRAGKFAEIGTRGVAYRQLSEGMERMGQDVRGGKDAEAHRTDTVGQAGEIRAKNPGTAELAQLEKYTPERLQQMREGLDSDEKRADFDRKVAGMQTRREELTKQLGAQGLLPVTTDQMRSFGDAMKIIEGKASEQGLPGGTFRQGLPVQFLDDVLKGVRPVQLRKHQS